MELGKSMGAVDVHAIEEQPVVVDAVQRTAETLNQGDSAGASALVGMAGFFDQVCGDHAVDDAECRPMIAGRLAN